MNSLGIEDGVISLNKYEKLNVPSSQSMPVRVLVALKNSQVREAYCAAIMAEPKLELVATLDNAGHILDYLSHDATDVLLSDIELHGDSGLEIIRTFVERLPQCDIIVAAPSLEEKYVFAFVESGAACYLLKNGLATDLIKIILIMRVHGSQQKLCIARKSLFLINNDKTLLLHEECEGIELTRREISVLHLIASGSTYSEIAQRLSIAIGTVQNHIKNIYRKLEVNSRSKAVLEAQRRGLLPTALEKR